MFHIEVERYETIIVGRFQGELVLENAVPLRRQLEELLKTNKVKDVALDLSTVRTIDNSGLGALVGACTTARAKGKRLMLYMPSSQVMETMEKADITGFFPMLEDESALKNKLVKRAQGSAE